MSRETIQWMLSVVLFSMLLAGLVAARLRDTTFEPSLWPTSATTDMRGAVTCAADGKTWMARKTGMCFMEDAAK